MRRNTAAIATGLGAFVLSPVALAAQSYTVVILHPPSGLDSTYASGAASGQQVGYSQGTTTHPFIWTGSANSVQDINPDGYAASRIFATDGVHQVGSGISVVSSSDWHALLWSGTATGVSDLNPNGYSTSYAYAVGGGQVAGIAWGPSTNNSSHAVVWDLSTGLATDLNPVPGGQSWAYGTDGVHQVGITLVRLPDGQVQYHGLVWSGSAASAIDLTPPGALDSWASAIFDGQIVGSANGRPAMWVGPNHIYVNLAPTPGSQGGVHATNGVQQVGGVDGHAAVWSGTPDSMLDLSQFLPVGLTDASPLAIDTEGNIVGSAFNGIGREAMMWVPNVPEPTTGVLATIFAVTCLLRRSQGGRKPFLGASKGSGIQ
jgi:hypothetical protein